MRTIRLSASVLGLLSLASLAVADQARIDFGSSVYTTPSMAGRTWNNVTNPNGGTTSLYEYASGAKTPWSMSITNPFLFLVDTNGTRTPTGAAADMGPASASRDAFQTIGAGQITLRNLNVNETYSLGLFASSTSWPLAKTGFAASGATTVSGTLDAYNNASRTLNFNNLRPAADGTIRLDVTRAGLSIGYLNEMTITSSRPVPQAAKNLLFFGNSFTLINDVPNLVGQFAVADGKLQPYVVSEVGDSRGLSDQLDQARTNPQNNINKIPAGKNWDNVVMQEFSTLPTHIGDPAGFRADAKTLFNLVKAKSPNVKPVLYETWAYRADSTLYAANPTADQFTNQAQMQAELRANYKLAKADLDALDGGATLLANVGDKWEQGGFPVDFYDTYDAKHPSTRGSTLAALVLYATIYDENVSDIPFANVQAWASARGLTQADWTRLTALADTDPAVMQAMIAAGVSPTYLYDSLAVVPEPTTLTVIGTLAWGVTRRRR